MKLICSFLIRNLAKKQCLSRIFYTVVNGTHREAKGGNEGEKLVTVYETSFKMEELRNASFHT